MKLFYKDLEFDISQNHSETEGFLGIALDFLQKWKDGHQSFLFHSSGSTGVPKPIELSRNQMRASAQATIKFFGLNQNDVAWLCLAPHYIAGAMMLVRAFEADMDLLLSDPSTEPELPTGGGKPTFVSFVPMQLAKASMPESLRVILVGGAPLSQSASHSVKALQNKIWESYAMTETASHVALRRLGHDHFVALPEVQIEQDPRGCLVICGPMTNHKKLITNDVVEITNHQKKQFKWLGRADNIINSGAIKVFPEKLENLILTHCNQEVYFTSFACDVLGEKLVMVVLENTDLDGINKLISTNFSRYETPKLIVSVKHFPLTENGKINRLALRKLSNGIS